MSTEEKFKQAEDAHPSKQETTQSVRLGSESSGRLDSVLAPRLPGLSRRALKQAFREGRVRQDGRRVRASSAASPGALITLREPPDRPQPAPCPLEFAYFDDQLLVLEKPAGIPSAPSGSSLGLGDGDSAAERVLELYPELAGVGDLPAAPGLCHRLDQETSGLLIFARDTQSFSKMRAAFRDRGIGKYYLAIVGGVAPEEGEVTLPLGHRKGRHRRMVVEDPLHPEALEDRWPAHTLFRRLEQSSGCSLLELQILTGVTHQIRAHLAHLGLPVLGDTLYGGAPAPRLALHASRLEFLHPLHGRAVQVESRQNNLLRVLL